MFKKKIFSRKLAFYLHCNGCKILGTEPNRQNPEWDVWIFEDGQKLQHLMTQYNSEK